MPRTHKIIKLGAMLGITFPKKMVEEYKLEKGTKFEISFDNENNRIILNLQKNENNA